MLRHRCQSTGALCILLRKVGIAGRIPRRPTALELEALCCLENAYCQSNRTQQAPRLDDVLGGSCWRRLGRPPLAIGGLTFQEAG